MPSSSEADPTGSSRRTCSPTPAGTCSSSRRSRGSVARWPVTRPCARVSSTTRSARSTRWPPRRRRSSGLGLEQHGLEWVHAPSVVGARRSARAGGRCCTTTPTRRPRVSTSCAPVTATPGSSSTGCGAGSRAPLIGSLLTPFPPVRHGTSLAAKVVRAGGLDLVRRLLLPSRALGDGALPRARSAAAAVGQRRARGHPGGLPGVGPDGPAARDDGPAARLPRAPRGARVSWRPPWGRGSRRQGAGSAPPAGSPRSSSWRPRRGGPHRRW